ncbi:MAG: type II secretion system F family protein [Dehalococcoidia bacterium]
MEFAYTAYTEDKKLVKGKVSAPSEEAASDLLSYGGYRIISLKAVTPFINKERLLASFSQVKPAEIAMFSRQLALLLEAGTDIVTSLDLLQGQLVNQTLRKTIGEVASDIRSGSSLSVALKKHPRIFSPMYAKAISAGEQGGNLEVVLRQMAEYIEKAVKTQKQIKGALTYPIVVVVVAIGVVLLLVSFVFPTFINLYSQLGAELPLSTRMLIGLTNWLNHYGLYLLLVLLVAAAAGYAYLKTPVGRYRWDKLMLSLPVIGRIVHLSELSRCCRTMAMLVRVGLPLPEVLAMSIHSSNNKFVVENLTAVQGELIKGEGLAQPMSKRSFFLPLMSQMVKIGEESGNLENTLLTVAENFDIEADDRTKSAVALIQPVLTIIIGLVVGFLVLSMLQAMYSIYGQFTSAPPA